jgi:hypothetical protein
MPSAKRVRIAYPIAIRRLAVVGEPGHEIVVTVGKPRPDPAQEGVWTCSILIEGLPHPARRKRVHGGDALQALQLAINDARLTLDRSGLQLKWDGAHEPGDVGIPRLMPAGWTVAFERRIERMVDAEVDRFARSITRKAERKRRERAAKGE